MANLQFHQSLNECLKRLNLQLVLLTDYVQEMERFNLEGQTYVKKSDPRIKYKNGYNVSYKKASSDNLLFGNIGSILLVRGLVLFAVKRLVVIPEGVPGQPNYENQMLTRIFIPAT